MSKRTQKEIKAEIKALEGCKRYVPKMNFFGDSNHNNLDLQIEELRHGIDDTADEWNDFSDSEQSAILHARDWREGDEKESPSSGWDNYKKKGSKPCA